MVRILVCAEKKHTDKQRNKHTFEKNEKKKKTDTEKETEQFQYF